MVDWRGNELAKKYQILVVHQYAGAHVINKFYHSQTAYAWLK